jgi:hypothetical protein
MSESVDINPPRGSWWDRHIKGEEYLAFHREPLAKVADKLGIQYGKELVEFLNEENAGSTGYLRNVINTRRQYCDARLQAAKVSKNNKEADKRLDWEKELNYSEIALKVIDNERKDTQVLKSVTGAIIGEIIELDRQLYRERKPTPSERMGKTFFDERIEKIRSTTDNFVSN